MDHAAPSDGLAAVRVRSVPVAPAVDLVADEWSAAPDDRSPAADRSPWVLVHGLASNARLWDGVARRLVDHGHPVVTVDLRGHGRSAKPDDGYDMATVADDIAALIADLGLARPYVAGQSWGGNVALELAARHPSAVSGVALVDGGWIELREAFPEWDACWAALAPPILAGRPYAELAARFRQMHPDWPAAGIAGALANFEVRPDGTVAPWLTRERHRAVLRGLWEHSPSERYPTLGVPALLLPADTGDAEFTARKRASVASALAALPCARAHWAVGDHDIHAQRPDEVGDVLHEMTDPAFFA